MMVKSRQRRCAGFTLLELMVALLVFVVLSAMTYRGLSNVMNVNRSTEHVSERLGELEMAFLFIERDLAQAVDRTVRDPLGTPVNAFMGGARQQSLIELTCFAGGGGELGRIGYLLEGNTLIRYRSPVLDQTQETKSERAELLSAVAAVQVRFLDKSWNETWPAANGGAALPRAVELTIKLEEGQEFKRLFTLPNA